MSFDFTLLSPDPYILTPKGAAAWIVWAALALLIGLLLYRFWSYNKTWGKQQVVLFVILLVLTPLTSLFFNIQFESLSTQFGVSALRSTTLAMPGIPLESGGQNALLFSAIPWILAGGLLGPLPAAVLGLLAGLLQALWCTHSPLTPLGIMLLAVIFSLLVNQRYRTPLYRLLRQPVIASLFLILIFPVVYAVTAPFIVSASPVIQLDYALANLPVAWLSVGLELLIAGLFAQMASLLLPTLWGNHAPLQPSPAERSLKGRFFYSMAPFGILFLVSLIVGSWFVAGAVAHDMLENQMHTITQVVKDQIPYFIGNGQQLITQMAANPQLINTPRSQLQALLEEEIKSTPFFSQLVLLDEQGRVIAAYPDADFTGKQTPVDDQTGIQMALTGIPFQYNALAPRKGSAAAQTSFLAPIKVDRGVRGVLIGRVDLAENPLTQPLVASLVETAQMLNDTGLNAEGMLLDDAGRILVHPNREMILTTYPGRLDSPEPFYSEIATEGARRLVYFQPINGIPWSVLITIPGEVAQQLAIRIAFPLVGMILILSALAVLVLDLGLGVITNSLKRLADEAENLARGNLDQSLPIEDEDEIGQLSRSFERMRISLKAHLDEQNQLLKVSQGVAANLNLEDAAQIILESILSTGASMARLIVSPAVIPEFAKSSSDPVRYSVGPAKNLYGNIDEQILGLTRQQDQLVLTSLSRPRYLVLSPESPRPASLIAFSLRHENQYYGALWAAYDLPHRFSEDEARFLATISSQAAVAAANARLFLNAEIGRKQLAAILASSPDPVLVIDQRNRLILANPAAGNLFGIGLETEVGQSIEKIITHKQLLALLQDPMPAERSAEISLQENHAYLASISSVIAEGQRVGRVCVLRDVTQFKELDALKSEFVSTVSHDLRTPLALMRGYATMLEMVGQLNEQQTNYARKILSGVDGMSRLVNNLLDLGRIEAGVGLQPEAISANEIVTRVINAQSLQATQKKIQIRTEFPSQPGDVMIEADPALLQQALQNLVDNAIKFTRNEGKVTVRVQPQTERVIFEVSDTGIGISPMDQAHLFEKFYRGPQTGSPENVSSGLGLAIVRSIAERHHGKVWAESQLGKGSNFFLAIPLRQPK